MARRRKRTDSNNPLIQRRGKELLGIPVGKPGSLPRTAKEKFYRNPAYHQLFGKFDRITAEIIRELDYVHAKGEQVPEFAVQPMIKWLVESFYGYFVGINKAERKEATKIIETVRAVKLSREEVKTLEERHVDIQRKMKARQERGEREDKREIEFFEQLPRMIDNAKTRLNANLRRLRKKLPRRGNRLDIGLRRIQPEMEGHGTLPESSALGVNIALYFNEVLGYNDEIQDITKKPLTKMHIIWYAGTELLKATKLYVKLYEELKGGTRK